MDSNAGDFSIDAISLWHIALNEAAINALKGIQMTPIPNVEGIWNCDDERGLVLTDTSGNGNDGTIPAASRFVFPDLIWPSPSLDHLSRRPGWNYSEAGWSGRWLAVDILDPDNPDGEFVAGILGAGTAWTLPRGRRYGGVPMGINDQSSVGATSGGQTTIRERGIQRVTRILVPHTDEIEVQQKFSEIARIRGGSRPVVLCIDPTEDDALETRILYGLLERRWSVPNPGLGLHEVPFNLVEML